jgi:hypothetical protein
MLSALIVAERLMHVMIVMHLVQVGSAVKQQLNEDRLRSLRTHCNSIKVLC